MNKLDEIIPFTAQKVKSTADKFNLKNEYEGKESLLRYISKAIKERSERGYYHVDITPHKIGVPWDDYEEIKTLLEDKGFRVYNTDIVILDDFHLGHYTRNFSIQWS